jgi:hypothetical protein
MPFAFTSSVITINAFVNLVGKLCVTLQSCGPVQRTSSQLTPNCAACDGTLTQTNCNVTVFYLFPKGIVETGSSLLNVDGVQVRLMV